MTDGSLRPVAGRLRDDAAWKARLAAGLLVLFAVPYFLLQRFPFLSARVFPPTALDRAVPFDPAWAWGYVSLYPLLVLVPWLLPDRASLTRFARAFVLLTLFCFVCFLLFPVAGPRPAAGARPAGGLYPLVLLWDRELNSFPSLHAGYAALVAVAGGRAARGLPRGAGLSLRLLAAADAAVVLYATLATKQHYAVDLPPGVALALLSDRLARRR